MRSVHFKSGVCSFQHPISPRSSLLRLSYQLRMTIAHTSQPTDYDRPWREFTDRTSIDEKTDIHAFGFMPRHFRSKTRSSSDRLRTIRNGARKKRIVRPNRVWRKQESIVIVGIAARSMEKI